MVPNIAHIKAFWIMQGIHLAQLALDWGCDDLDGTVVWYDITKRAGDGVHQEMHVSDILRSSAKPEKSRWSGIRCIGPSCAIAAWSPEGSTPVDAVEISESDSEISSDQMNAQTSVPGWYSC